MSLTYYAYEGINEATQPVNNWASKDNEWTYDHTTRKANNHSKIAWWTYKHDQYITFTYYDLRDDPKGSLCEVRALNTLGLSY